MQEHWHWHANSTIMMEEGYGQASRAPIPPFVDVQISLSIISSGFLISLHLSNSHFVGNIRQICHLSAVS